MLRLADDVRWAEWFTAPRLLDVFALYGFTDGAICARIIHAAHSASPSLSDTSRRSHRCRGHNLPHRRLLCSRGGGCGRSNVATATAPERARAQGAADVESLSSWLQDAMGSLHALLQALPASLLREQASSSSSSSSAALGPLGVVLTGPSGLLTAFQLIAEAALPRLRRAATAANALSTVHDQLAAAGIHCAHAAGLLLSKALIAGSVSGGKGGGRGGKGGGKGSGGGGGKGGGKGGGRGGGKGSGGVASNDDDWMSVGPPRLLDAEELMGCVLQLSDPCEMLAECDQLYERLGVPRASDDKRSLSRRLVEGRARCSCSWSSSPRLVRMWSRRLVGARAGLRTRSVRFSRVQKTRRVAKRAQAATKAATARGAAAVVVMALE